MSTNYDWYTYVDDHGANWRIWLNKRCATFDPGTTGTAFNGAVALASIVGVPVVDFRNLKPRYGYWIDTVTGKKRKIIACTTTCRAYNPIASPVASIPKYPSGTAVEANTHNFYESEGERWRRGCPDAAGS